MDYSFKFVDDTLNRQLVALLRRSGARFRVDSKGTIRYSKNDVEFIENDVISRVRTSVFPTWQIISCPSNWAPRYKEYMLQRNVPFVEELIDNQLCFLIPRIYRPHSWKLELARRKVS